jgi:hypothetical protein
MEPRPVSYNKLTMPLSECFIYKRFFMDLGMAKILFTVKFRQEPYFPVFSLTGVPPQN